MEYVEHSTMSLSHHGIFSRQDRTKIFTKMFGYTECKCLLSSLFESFPFSESLLSIVQFGING